MALDKPNTDGHGVVASEDDVDAHAARGQRVGKELEGQLPVVMEQRISLASVFTITKWWFLQNTCAIYAHRNKSTLGVLVKIPFTQFSRAKGVARAKGKDDIPHQPC